MNKLLPTEAAVFADIEDAHRTLAPLMTAIAAAVGDHCEVVLHNLSAGDLEHSIYAIVNGHVSGRGVGGPSTNLGLEVLHDETADHNAFGYRARTHDGRDLLSSSVYYRAADLVASLVPAPRASADSAPQELVGQDVSSVLDEMITDAITMVGKSPSSMSKADRIEVLRLLETRGAFHIKRAADKVSSRLGVSRVTVYGYLDEVRRG